MVRRRTQRRPTTVFAIPEWSYQGEYQTLLVTSITTDMANFGKVLLRRDSLSKNRSKSPGRQTWKGNITTTFPAASIASSSPGSPSQISFEDGQRILREAARRRSEPSPVEIVQIIDDLNTQGLERQEIQEQQDEDGASSIDIDTIIASYEQAVAARTPAHRTINSSTRSSLRNSTSSTSSRRDSVPRRSPHSLNLSLQRTHSAKSEAPMRPVSLFVASLGNPPPYHSTRHSAGHIVLQNLQRALSLPALVKSRSYAGGLHSSGAEVGRPEIHLWQSPTLMNISGPTLLKAWRQFTTQASSSADPITGLVILHDELELEAGRTKLKRGESSARGHNGIKSVQNSLASTGDLKKLGSNFIKVAIGIGRPDSGTRAKGDVSAYVLGQLTSREKEGLEAAANQLSFELYQEIARMGKESS